MISAELIELATQFLKDRTKQTIYLDKEILAYRWSGGRHGSLLPIDVNLSLTLDDLHGIDGQKAQLIQNTRQFLQGLPANHVLMTGSRGAGKSSLIRGLLAKFYSQGLRVIEVARDDLYHLDKIRQVVKNTNNNCHYIVFCDDLAFNVEDENYRTLKSILDGALDSEQERLLVYATSNRRHLLPQMMKDNLNIYNGQTSEVNPYETIDEAVSLSDRFGLWLSFHPMNQDTYLDIVRHYLGKNKLSLDDTAKHEALKWASLRGGRSGRIAYQFSRHWIGSQMLMD
ncbi:MAG: ATP-binding protein [Moraxella sp.]